MPQQQQRETVADFDELLTQSGHNEELTVQDAIDIDWMAMLADVQAQIFETMRMTADHHRPLRNKDLRRKFRLLRYLTEQWEKSLRNL